MPWPMPIEEMVPSSHYKLNKSSVVCFLNGARPMVGMQRKILHPEWKDECLCRPLEAPLPILLEPLVASLVLGIDIHVSMHRVANFSNVVRWWSRLYMFSIWFTRTCNKIFCECLNIRAASKQRNLSCAGASSEVYVQAKEKVTRSSFSGSSWPLPCNLNSTLYTHW